MGEEFQKERDIFMRTFFFSKISSSISPNSSLVVVLRRRISTLLRIIRTIIHNLIFDEESCAGGSFKRRVQKQDIFMRTFFLARFHRRFLRILLLLYFGEGYWHF